MQTDVQYSVGSVWTVDMLHVPFGVRVSPVQIMSSNNAVLTLLSVLCLACMVCQIR